MRPLIQVWERYETNTGRPGKWRNKEMYYKQKQDKDSEDIINEMEISDLWRIKNNDHKDAQHD